MKLYESGVYLINGCEIVSDAVSASQKAGFPVTKEEALKGTISYGILKAHNHSGDMRQLQLRYDSLTSHDITYVGIIQTARASGMKHFPIPYVLTNCHNSLCAVGGTINEDDHKFALSACHKYGGIYVPTNMAVLHSYNREMMAGCGKMILGSDSHTRYGALGTMAVGEGGGELAKQLVGRTYDMSRPEVVLVYLEGQPQSGVGPHDVALQLCKAVYSNAYVKNKVMEFVGPGIKSLPMEYRNGIDVMTTETTCWSSVWATDEQTENYLRIHGRPEDYRSMQPSSVAYYDGCIRIDLSKIECSVALPMHPSNVFTIRELNGNASDILALCEEKANRQIVGASLDLRSKAHDGGIWVDQALVAGCSGGTFDNICAIADIMRGHSTGNGTFTMSVYPGSMPAYLHLLRNGALADIASAGVIVRECFCGPCFGAGDTPANGELSIRHTTRNFPNREGSKPGEGQMCGVALMDARSIAATAINGGKLTAATDLDISYNRYEYEFDKAVYDRRIYNGFGKPEADYPLKFGPNIRDWPEMPALSDDMLVKICSYITDSVTTTDELIPSGETASYRSNPERLSEFALSRKDPGYVPRAKAVRQLDLDRRKDASLTDELKAVYSALSAVTDVSPETTNIASAIFAVKPGDGSAREQAASCQRVLGGGANFAVEYATKRYRSNCVNWGLVPFLVKDAEVFSLNDWVFIPGIRKAVLSGAEELQAWTVKPDGKAVPFTVSFGTLTENEKHIIADGCLINYYRSHPSD